MKKLAVIGLGNMGQALVKGILAAKAVNAADLTGIEKDKRTATAVASSTKIKVSSAYSGIKNADVVILAVKPQHMKEVLKEIKPLIQKQLVISIAAGISTAFIREILGDRKIVRCMPNTPALVLKGVTGIYCTEKVSEGEREYARKVFNAVGATVFVDKEDDIDKITALSGSGPAYVFYFMEALEDAGVMIGLPRDTARTLVSATFEGSSALVSGTGKHPTLLKEMVTSPGGTTISALYELENGAVKSTVYKAVMAAYKKAKELGK